LQNLNPDVFKSTTLKIGIDKKSLFPQKENIDLTMEIIPSDINRHDHDADDAITLTMKWDITYTDYNIPVTIELPAAAQKCRRKYLNR